jgi:poly-gamma-glutamate synthesis protein (capsule biosynthesis protein)
VKGKFVIALLLLAASLPAGAQLLPSRREVFLREEALRKPLGDIDFDALRRDPDTLTLYFIGDVMAHGPMTESAFRQYRKAHPDARKDAHASHDYSTFFRHLEEPIAAADLAICNMEFPLGGPPFTGYPCFSAPDVYPDYLIDKGFDILLTANNHILDKGDPGLRRTVEVCDRVEKERGVRHTGVVSSEEDMRRRYPLLIEKKGILIALINFTYGTNMGSEVAWPRVNRMNRMDIGKAIERAKDAGADVIVALPHWGVEYQFRHSPSQEELARWMIAQGVDLVIGSHPHVAQDIQVIDGKTVIYSLGNAVSNQNDLIARLELCAAVDIRIGKDGRAVVEPPRVRYLWCTKPGMIDDSYTVVPVASYLENPGAWRVREDYDNMVSTYRKVQKENHVYEENDPTGSH